MNSKINYIYLLLQDNEVLHINTNLQDFHRTVSKSLPLKHYRSLARKFTATNRFNDLINGKVYWFIKHYC